MKKKYKAMTIYNDSKIEYYNFDRKITRSPNLSQEQWHTVISQLKDFSLNMPSDTRFPDLHNCDLIKRLKKII